MRKLSRIVNFHYAKEKSVLVQIKDSRLKISENVKYRGEIINYVVAASPFFSTPFLPAGILFSPLHPPSTPSPSVSRLHSSAMLTMWSTPTTRMLLQDHGLTVVPVDDSLNYSQRFPLRFHLPGITSLCVIQDEISKCVYLRILLQCKINCWVYRYSFIVRLEVYRISL